MSKAEWIEIALGGLATFIVGLFPTSRWLMWGGAAICVAILVWVIPLPVAIRYALCGAIIGAGFGFSIYSYQVSRAPPPALPAASATPRESSATFNLAPSAPAVSAQSSPSAASSTPQAHRHSTQSKNYLGIDPQPTLDVALAAYYFYAKDALKLRKKLDAADKLANKPLDPMHIQVFNALENKLNDDGLTGNLKFFGESEADPDHPTQIPPPAWRRVQLRIEVMHGKNNISRPQVHFQLKPRPLGTINPMAEHQYLDQLNRLKIRVDAEMFCKLFPAAEPCPNADQAVQ